MTVESFIDHFSNPKSRLIFSPLKFNVSAPPPNKIEIMNSHRLGTFINNLVVLLILPALALAIYVGWITGNGLFAEFQRYFQAGFFNILVTPVNFIASVFGGFLAAGLVLIVPIMLGACSVELLDEVTEISEDSKISAALSLSEQYPEIDAYRKEVISQGRMFLNGDLKAMECFAQEQEATPKLDATELALQQYKKDRVHENMRRLLTP